MTHHALDHVLLAGSLVAFGDQHAAGDVACDAEAQDHGRERKWSCVIINAPCASAERDLEARVKIEQDDDGNEEFERERVMCRRFVGLVEGVRF